MYLLCIQIGELLKFDFDYINFLTSEAVKEILKQLKDMDKAKEESDKAKEESGKAEENPTTDNN